MPAPFAIPPSRTSRPATVNARVASFGWESVVQIATAASCPPSADSAAAAARMPASTRSIGSGTPITPVEQTRTSSPAPVELADQRGHPVRVGPALRARGGVGVAARHHHGARRPARREALPAQQHGCAGGAAAREHARGGGRAVGHHERDVGPPDALIPPVAPAARKPRA